MSKLTSWLSRTDRESEDLTTKPTTPEAIAIGSPIEGTLIPLTQVEDPMFSSGMMGPGIAVRPVSGQLRAPFAGTVKAIFPTGHAVGMMSDSGLEVLMHIGIDTVDLRGAHFQAAVAAGQRVAAGELLVNFDIPAIQDAGYILTTPIVVMNSKSWTLTINADPGEVHVGDLLITASKIAKS